MRMNFSYGSVCSGIEAASVAWHTLGWRAAWFAEVEPNPSAILAHRWPDVPNLGDMTLLARYVRAGYIEAPDVLVGGTPCQAFSVAGLRGGLTDARGQLTLTYVDLANAIDEKRGAGNECVIYWENVPGVLSDATNAFGCLLGALAGEDGPLVNAGGKWSNAGLVVGPQRAIAWRVLDAQYFGVAQRRRRVFLVASARDGFDPAKLLFELDGLRRDSAPRRETGQDVTGTLASRTGAGGYLGTDEACSGHVQPVAFGGNNTAGPIDIATARNACASASGRMDFESETFLVQPAPLAFDCKSSGQSGFGVGEIASTLRAMGHAGSHANGGGHLAVCVTGDIAHTLKAEGFDASEDGTGRGQPIVAFDYKGANSCPDVTPSLTTGGGGGMGGGMSAQYGMAVRRLTPVECERLQGFPDNYTLVPMDRRKPPRDGERRGEPRMMADGPRYKALGNSMAVPCMRWLGVRLMLTHPTYFY